MLPIETIEAVFPATAEVGKVLLLPMTIAHATFLEVIGVDLTRPIQMEKIVLCTWVLSLTGDELRQIAPRKEWTVPFKKWYDRKTPNAYLLIDAVERQIAAAFDAFVPPMTDDDKQTVYTIQRGFGWTLELCEALMSNYGMTMNEAMDTPLCQCYALINCNRQRNCGKNGGPDYYERIAFAAARSAMKKKQETKKQ